MFRAALVDAARSSHATPAPLRSMRHALTLPFGCFVFMVIQSRLLTRLNHFREALSLPLLLFLSVCVYRAQFESRLPRLAAAAFRQRPSEPKKYSSRASREIAHNKIGRASCR